MSDRSDESSMSEDANGPSRRASDAPTTSMLVQDHVSYHLHRISRHAYHRLDFFLDLGFSVLRYFSFGVSMNPSAYSPHTDGM